MAHGSRLLPCASCLLPLSLVLQKFYTSFSRLPDSHRQGKLPCPNAAAAVRRQPHVNLFTTAVTPQVTTACHKSVLLPDLRLISAKPDKIISCRNSGIIAGAARRLPSLASLLLNKTNAPYPFNCLSPQVKHPMLRRRIRNTCRPRASAVPRMKDFHHA